jgi:hypothetical protein
MTELSNTTGKTVADLTKGISPGNLAEQHGHKLAPGSKSLRPALRSTLIDKPLELCPGELLKKLVEQTCSARHINPALFCFECLGFWLALKF